MELVEEFPQNLQTDVAIYLYFVFSFVEANFIEEVEEREGVRGLDAFFLKHASRCTAVN